MGTINHDTLTIHVYEVEGEDFLHKRWYDYQQIYATHGTDGLLHTYSVPVNGGKVFVFGSCGSQDGWGAAESLRDFYRELCKQMDERGGYAYCWVQFGDEPARIVLSH